MAFLLAAGTTWKLGSPKWYAQSIHIAVSPDERYRLEIFTAFYLTSSNYGFARLYNNRTGKLMCESSVEWLTSNGNIAWPLYQGDPISVGRDIWFNLSHDGSTCRVEASERR